MTSLTSAGLEVRVNDSTSSTETLLYIHGVGHQMALATRWRQVASRVTRSPGYQVTGSYPKVPTSHIAISDDIPALIAGLFFKSADKC